MNFKAVNAMILKINYQYKYENYAIKDMKQCFKNTSRELQINEIQQDNSSFKIIKQKTNNCSKRLVSVFV